MPEEVETEINLISDADETLSVPQSSTINEVASDVESHNEILEPKTIQPTGAFPYEIDIQKKLIKAFELFDEDKTWIVKRSDVGTVLRYLNCYPSEADVQDLLSQVTASEDKETEEPDEVYIPSILPILTKVFLEDRFRLAPEESLLKAFQIFDEEGKGVIDSTAMRDFLLIYGENFTEEEAMKFVNFIEDKNSKTIDYQQYCKSLYQ